MIGAILLPGTVQRARDRMATRAGRSWHSPQAQPRYATAALLGILAMAAVLFSWDIQHSGYHAFYSETAHSMALSWKAFLFGSFDPGNSITIDKLPGFLWPQALSARIFGFHGWALTLPQVIEGVLSVVVLYRAVRRWAGANAGLLAAGVFTLTPAIAGLFRTEVEDPSFTLLVLLAGDATLRAARDARLRPLLAAAVWVGLSFQAKMLEAWAVLPALGLLYVVSAPTVLRRRLAHLAAAGALCLVVSASWVMVVTLTPAKDRPYIDGTTDNSAVSQVVGYNFLNRFSSLGVSAKSTGSVDASTMVGTAPAPKSSSQGLKEWGKMLGKSLASQTGWLYPAVALSAVFGLVRRRGKPRTDPLRAGFLLWTVWLATYALVFSAGSVGGHTYYMGVVAAPLAALFGAGMVQLWRAWRDGSRAGAWALPAAVVSTVGWSVAIAEQFPLFLPWLAPVAVALGVAAVGLLVVARRGGGGTGTAAGSGPSVRTGSGSGTAAGSGSGPGARTGPGTGGRRRMAVLGLGVAIASMLLPPAAWASSVLNPVYGHSGMGTTGPAAVSHVAQRAKTPAGAGAGAGAPTALPKSSAKPATGAHPSTGTTSSAPATSGGASLNPQQRQLLAYTQARRHGATYLFMTMSWRSASPYILYTNAKVLPAGGFTGAVPSPTPAGFLRLVATGQLRYVVLTSPLSKPATWIKPWVEQHCTHTAYRPTQLYLCSPKSVG